MLLKLDSAENVNAVAEAIPSFFRRRRNKKFQQEERSNRQVVAKFLIETLARMVRADRYRSGLLRQKKAHVLGFDPEKILSSNLIDAEYYRNKYSDIRGDDTFVLKHFAFHGQFEGRRPSIFFDPEHYRIERQRSEYRTDPGSELPDFVHFLAFGWKKGLNPSALFDVSWYLQANPDVRDLDICPLYHFATLGLQQGRSPSSHVDIPWYANQYSLDTDDPRAVFENMVRKFPSRALSCGDYLSRCLPRSGARRGDQLLVDLIGERCHRGPCDLAPAIPASFRGGQFPRIDDAEIITVDIWDTVLRRDCDPDEIKLQSARYLFLNERNRLKPFFQDVRRLLSARLQSEAAVATGEDREFRLQDALRHWLALTLATKLHREAFEDLVQALLEQEYTIEIRTTRVDKATDKFLEQQSVPKIFVSDFYTDQKFINNLLVHHGIDHHFVGGYVSSEHRRTKRTGRLFDLISQDLRLDPKKWLHFGDNKISDYDSPAARGIQSFLYVSPEEADRSSWYTKAFKAYTRGDVGLHERRILSLIDDHASAYTVRNDREARLQRIGARLSCIAVGFVLSVLEDAIANKIGEVFFFTREGAFFKKMAETLIGCDPYNVEYPKLSLLEVSRLSTFAPSLRSLDERSFMRLWRQYSSQSLKDFSLSLGLDCGSLKRIAARYRILWSKKIDFPWMDDKFKAFIRDPEFLSILGLRVDRQGEALRSYLKSKGFGLQPERAEMIVDIGWRGTIQDNLAEFMSIPIRGHYLGLMAFLNPQPKASFKIGYLFDENLRPADSPVPKDVAPFEMIYNVLGGSVVGYAMETCDSKPQRHVESDEENVISNSIIHIQKGMIDCAPLIADYLRRHGLTSQDMLHIAQQTTRALCAEPPADIADAFFDLRHNESFGAGQIDHIGASLDLVSDSAERACTGGSEVHRLVSQLASVSRWQDGLPHATKFRRLLDNISEDAKTSLPTQIFVAQAPRVISMRGQSVSVYCPSPIAGSGGHRTIFNVARALARLGLNLECFVDGLGDGLDLIEDWLDGAPARIHSQWHAHIKADFALATVANSAHYVADLPHARTKGYLVQDLESLFNPVSDGYLVAENSYRFGLRHYTIGNWLAHLLPRQYGAETTAAGLGVDTSIYHMDASTHREVAVCFLYQPDKPRRLPQTALEALKMVSDRVPGVRIYVYGSETEINPGFRIEQLGMVRDLRKLNELYNRCRAGLCLSMSNPSRIPFEMMAAGCVPVDLYRQNNLFDYANDSAVLAYQSASSIADALVKLLTCGQEEISGLRDKAKKFASGRSLAWEVDTIVNSVIAQIEGRKFIQNLPKPTYTRSAHLAAADDTEATRWFCAHQRDVATSG